MKTTFIYVLKCPLSGEVRYVGKTNNPTRRYYGHLNNSRDKNTYKRNWINSLKRSCLKPIFEIVDEVDVKEWKMKEKCYIKYYRNKGCRLVNYTDGGDGLGFGNQTSFKKGIKPWNCGSRLRKICAVCNKEFEVSPSRYDYYKCCSMKCSKVYRSTSKNVGKFKKGIVPWNKDKSLCKNTVNSKPVLQIDIKTKKILNRFPSAAEAERQIGVNQDSITNNTNGRSKSAGGFEWKKEKV